MNSAVVVGGCGFLGRYVSDGLAAAGVEVVSVHRGPRHDDVSDGVRCVTTDYRDTAAISPLLARAQILVHLGSQSVPRTSVELGVTGVLAEVDANARLFDEAARVGVQKVVFSSSGGSVYGHCASAAPIHESHPCAPISPHGLLKVMTELALSHISLVSGQSSTSLRPGNIYGPGQRSRPQFGIVPTFLANLRAGRSSEIWGAESVRDYVHVEDAAAAFVCAATTTLDLPRAMNVGTGLGHSAVQVYAILQELLGVQQPVVVLPRPESDPVYSVLAPQLLQESLGIVARTPLREGLRSLILADSMADLAP